ncbi:hypothetical protein B0H17DRAFT_1104134 [Mycena rosella]|uniref:Uncharacterized protein n=1 Tax=Mycena rosella TaxID=1033263 RepID=A0AAD7CD72_MYCRO|nr:hypothetical protein B0H17DRAFT_1104134 [Mycena rosella]
MSVVVDQDVFSHILSHVSDTRTVHTILRALPKSHPLFSTALYHRLSGIPVYLDTFDARSAAASNQVLDYLLAVDVETDAPRIAEAIRYLVVAVEHEKYDVVRWGEVVEGPQLDEEKEEEEDNEEEEDEPEYETVEAVNTTKPKEEEYVDVAATFDPLITNNYPGLPLTAEHVRLLSGSTRLQTFCVDSAVRQTANQTSQAHLDPEQWDIEPFLFTLVPSITSLELRHVCQTTLLTLVSHGDVFATLGNLKRLKMDITEGVWDWDGAGSPQRGGSPDYIFPSLRLPALRVLELVVGDYTILKACAGPLDLVDCTLLTELSLDIRQCIWTPMPESKLFEAVQWHHRSFPDLVERFLPSLSNLVSLWPGSRSSTSRGTSEVWRSPDTDHQRWRTAIQTVFPQLESLRVGFGVVDATDVGVILSCCDPSRLRQFGFAWAWAKHGHDEPISPALLAHLARFPKLTDVHILYPRRRHSDLASVFRCNGSIRRVGIGNSVVWERNYVEYCGAAHEVHSTADAAHSAEVILISDGSEVGNPVVLRFYNAGYMARCLPDKPWWRHSDNIEPLRPQRAAEIEELRDLLKKILD